jgi:hypothetical protein
MAIKNTVDFSVDVVGELTNNSYVGTFVAKTKLSMRETLRQDEVRRQILGVNPQSAGEDAQRVAAAIAYLSVHIVQSPDWWKELEGGLKIEELNLLAEVNNKCQEAIDKEYKKLNEEATKAKGELEKLPV